MDGITNHADVVGSLLRPKELLDARAAYQEGRLGPAEWKVVEDMAVDQAVAMQQRAGLKIVTDGEMRRLSFQSQLTDAVDGFKAAGLSSFTWGRWRGGSGVGDYEEQRPEQLGVVGKLRRRRYPSVEELVYLRAQCRDTDTIPKVTLPSPSLFANFWSRDCSCEAYPTLDSFLADVANLLRDEVAELVRLGVRYIQLDAPHYPLLLDPETRKFYEQQGWDRDAWLAQGIALDNAVLEGFPGVTFGFHLCRGNQASRWLVEGDYGPIARQIFPKIRAHRLLLEYDDARSGSFDSLQWVPEDKMVVLGLVTTKSARKETPEGLAQSIEEATRYIPKHRLAISPQCGFSSSILGNQLTIDDQERKLVTTVDTAHRVWGSA